MALPSLLVPGSLIGPIGDNKLCVAGDRVLVFSQSRDDGGLSLWESLAGRLKLLSAGLPAALLQDGFVLEAAYPFSHAGGVWVALVGKRQAGTSPLHLYSPLILAELTADGLEQRAAASQRVWPIALDQRRGAVVYLADDYVKGLGAQELLPSGPRTIEGIHFDNPLVGDVTTAVKYLGWSEKLGQVVVVLVHTLRGAAPQHAFATYGWDGQQLTLLSRAQPHPEADQYKMEQALLHSDPSGQDDIQLLLGGYNQTPVQIHGLRNGVWSLVQTLPPCALSDVAVDRQGLLFLQPSGHILRGAADGYSVVCAATPPPPSQAHTAAAALLAGRPAPPLATEYVTELPSGGLLMVVPDRDTKPAPAVLSLAPGATKWQRQPLTIGPAFRPLPPGYAHGVRTLFVDPVSGHPVLITAGAAGYSLCVQAADGYFRIVAQIELTADGERRGYSANRAVRTIMTYRSADRCLLVAAQPADGSAAWFSGELLLGSFLDQLPKPGQVAVPRSDLPPPTSYPLALRDEQLGSNKFWLARVDGVSFTVEWGKRGAKKAQSKTTATKSADKARAEVEKRVAEKLGEGYAVIPEGDEAARTGQRPQWPLVPTGLPPAAGEDFLHGEPGEPCPSCGTPLAHLITLYHHPDRLPLSGSAALEVYVCTTVSCQPWAPSSGANAVHLRASAPRPGPSALGIRYEPPTLEPEPKDAEDAEGLSGGSKLGGYPLWIQGAETPDCADCGSRMALCCQLGDDDVGQNFGDCGVGYLFLCPRRCSGQFLSQSS